MKVSLCTEYQRQVGHTETVHSDSGIVYDNVNAVAMSLFDVRSECTYAVVVRYVQLMVRNLG